MRILLIARNLPRPPTSGAAQRTELLMSALLQIGDVDVVVLSDRPARADAIVAPARLLEQIVLTRETAAPYPTVSRYSIRAAALLNALSSRYGLQVSPAIAGRIRQIVAQGKYDIVVARYLVTYAQCDLTWFPNVVVDIDDLPTESFSTTLLASASGWRKVFYRSKLAALDSRMKRLAASCRRVWVANPEHVRLFDNASVLPNIPYPFEGELSQTHSADECNRVLFVGSLGYPPNQDAVRYFLHEVWPRVSARMPTAEFRVAGADCPLPLEQEIRATSGATYLGFVYDLCGEYEQCGVVVAPMFGGSGTNIKVLEAMRYGRACIISPFAAKGLSHVLESDRNVLIAASPEEFADQTVQCLADEAWRRRIGDEAARVVAREFSVNMFNRIVQETLLGARAASSVLECRRNSGGNDW